MRLSAKVAVEGLEPSRENTVHATTLGGGGSPGGTVNPNSAFNTALIESGFSPAEVTRILAALNEAGLAVVAMGRVRWRTEGHSTSVEPVTAPGKQNS